MWKWLKYQLAFLAVLWTVASSASINVSDTDIDVDKTVQTVQDILEANPLLPRLSQDEILALLNNITTEDKLKNDIGRRPPKNRNKDQQEGEKIMVVLPYQPTEHVDISELYTKRPITKIVSSNPPRDREELTTKSSADKKNKKKKPTTPAKSEETKNLLLDENFLAALNEQRNSIPNDKLVNFNHNFSPDQQPVETSQIALPDVSAYETFKPIPIAKQSDDQVPDYIRNILKSLGFQGIKDKKPENQPAVQDKQEQSPKFEFIDPETFPAEMTSLLTDLGLTKNNGKFADAPRVTSSSSKGRKITASMKESLHTSASNEHLAIGPDPLSVDEAISVDDAISNDLRKRQQSDNVSSTTAAPTTSTTTTEESSPAPNLSDLEDSFGASPADDDPSEAVLPPPRRNGFYYMVDWNSFLEVGDGDTKVNIRFDPKLGDPQRFIAVNVP